MDSIKKEKREGAELFPYKRVEGQYMFYLQKRSMTATRAPGKIGMFGGGREGNEAIEQNLLREMKEELNYVPKNHEYFSRFETATNIFHIFIEEVGDDFESILTIQEGDYGLFISVEEIMRHELVTPVTKLIALQVAEYLEK